MKLRLSRLANGNSRPGSRVLETAVRKRPVAITKWPKLVKFIHKETCLFFLLEMHTLANKKRLLPSVWTAEQGKLGMDFSVCLGQRIGVPSDALNPLVTLHLGSIYYALILHFLSF